MRYFFRITQASPLLTPLLAIIILLSVVAGWLFQRFTAAFCYTELSIIYVSGILFWAAMIRPIRYYSRRRPLWPKPGLRSFLTHTALSIGALSLNQLVTQAFVYLILWGVFHCTTLPIDWDAGLLTNNILGNFFCYWLILAWEHWRQYNETASTPPATTITFEEKLCIKDGGRIIPLPVENVRWIEADNNCVVIHTGKRKYVQYQSLKSLEKKLDPRHFLRIHRSHLVNLDHIIHLESLPGGDGTVILRCGQRLRFSRTYRQPLRAALFESKFSIVLSQRRDDTKKYKEKRNF